MKIAATDSVIGARPGFETGIGIGMHSFAEAWRPAPAGDASGPRFAGARAFLEYAHGIGARGVQVVLRPEEFEQAPAIGARARELGLYFEGQFSLPREAADLVRFESEVRAVVAAGGRVARTAVLGTRRYESVRSLAEWREFVGRGRRWLELAEPVLRRHRLVLAVENHKDWLAPELADLLRGLGSEWVGACVDTGNSIALLEDPYEVVEVLAPFARSTHVKDMAVREHPEGFRLSEVPLGEGFLDLSRMVSTLRRGNPELTLTLEMITRDPLVVPCLTTGYWETFPGTPAARLAAALARARRDTLAKPEAAPLPHTSGMSAAEKAAAEDANVRRCVAWARGQTRAG